MNIVCELLIGNVFLKIKRELTFWSALIFHDYKNMLKIEFSVHGLAWFKYLKSDANCTMCTMYNV